MRAVLEALAFKTSWPSATARRTRSMWCRQRLSSKRNQVASAGSERGKDIDSVVAKSRQFVCAVDCVCEMNEYRKAR